MRSKIHTFFLITSLVLLSSTIYSQEKGFGLGIILGEPSGISGKYWLSANDAVDFGIGYSFISSKSEFSFHTDYLYHIKDLIKSDYNILPYYGFGLRLRLKENNSGAFGVRGVAGILWLLDNTPIDLFFEFAPSFRLLPNTGLDLDIGLGGRYYFE